MDNRTTEIRAHVNGMYITECFGPGTSTPAMINAIKSRYGGQDVQINMIRHNPAPSPGHDSGQSGTPRS